MPLAERRGFALWGHPRKSITRDTPEFQYSTTLIKRDNVWIHPKPRKLMFTKGSLMIFAFLSLPYKRLSRSWWRCVLFRSSGASLIRTSVGIKIVQVDAKPVPRVQRWHHVDRNHNSAADCFTTTLMIAVFSESWCGGGGLTVVRRGTLLLLFLLLLLET